MQDQIYFLSQNTTLQLIIGVSFLFALIGISYSRKNKGLQNYLTAGRNVGVISLTTSLVASALGAWILFGPASAATWGGIGSVIGYSLGAAFPMIALIFLGTKVRKNFSRGNTLTEFIYLKFGKNLFKLILILTIFYMFIFLCAEVTAITILVNYISGIPLWQTATVVIVSTLIYTLYGGLRASILTDNLQFFIVLVLLIISGYYFIFINSDYISLEYVQINSSYLISNKYIPNYTSGLTFFIAVAATNLFHQGNWQRVFAAKNDEVLKKSLLLSFLIIIPIVFFMGLTGIFAISVNSEVNPDLAFFSILLKENTKFLSLVVIILAISLTISTIDTLVNAISSIFIVDGKKIYKGFNKQNNFKLSKFLVIVLSLISLIIASKGYSVLYLFLLADLLCCAAVFNVFYAFYQKKFNEKYSINSILLGLFLGLLLFPTPEFSKSILVGILMPLDLFPQFISNYLLFWSFLIATLVPSIVIITYDSFKRR